MGNIINMSFVAVDKDGIVYRDSRLSDTPIELFGQRYKTPKRDVSGNILGSEIDSLFDDM